MSFTIHPFCENGDTVPKNCVHAGPVSLGLLPKDYKADTNQLWRAGIDPGTNLLVASTTFSRGLVGSAATSTPRYWWISGPINDQNTLEAKVKEVVGRLPERAVDNYVPFSDYATAYEWAKTNGYALINCNYPAYQLGDFSSNTESLINIETGFLPSFDGSQYKLRNLANPTSSMGFGPNSPYAVPHDSIVVQTTGLLGSPAGQIGNETGIQLLSASHISQITNPIQSGVNNGIIFEGVITVPDGGATSFTLLQARGAANNSLFTLGWDHVTSGWHINFNGSLAYQDSVPPAGWPAGKYYFCVAIPRVQNGTPVYLYINGVVRALNDVSISSSWSVADVRFTFGSQYDGSNATKQVNRFHSAKVHNLIATWDSSSADSFNTTNWSIVSALYGI